MILSDNNMETKVYFNPYEESTIDKGDYVQMIGKGVLVTTVPNHEDKLVKIILSNGSSEIVRADQIILAVEKCVSKYGL